MRDDELSIKIFNCSQNFTFARFARKIWTSVRLLVFPKFLQLLHARFPVSIARDFMNTSSD